MTAKKLTDAGKLRKLRALRSAFITRPFPGETAHAISFSQGVEWIFGIMERDGIIPKPRKRRAKR